MRRATWDRCIGSGTDVHSYRTSLTHVARDGKRHGECPYCKRMLGLRKTFRGIAAILPVHNRTQRTP